MVLNQRRLSEQGIHVKEERDEEYAAGKPAKAEKYLKSLDGEWRWPLWIN